MPVNIEGSENLKQKQIQVSTKGDKSLIGLLDSSESEIKWVKLHQMFDR